MIAIKIITKGPVPGINLKASEVNRIRKECWEEIGRHWADVMRPQHFTAAGAKKYGYQPRKGEESGTSGKAFWRSYTGRKLKQKGHKRPLVWSGESESESARYRIDATRNGVRVVMPARKLNFRNPKSNINMADELRTITANEHEELVSLYQQRLDIRLSQYRETTTTEVG